MNPSNKSIHKIMEESVDVFLKIRVDVGYNYIQDNTKSVLKRRKQWKEAISSEIARDYWYAKFKNKEREE